MDALACQEVLEVAELTLLRWTGRGGSGPLQTYRSIRYSSFASTRIHTGHRTLRVAQALAAPACLLSRFQGVRMLMCLPYYEDACYELTPVPDVHVALTVSEILAPSTIKRMAETQASTSSHSLHANGAEYPPETFKMLLKKLVQEPTRFSPNDCASCFRHLCTQGASDAQVSLPRLRMSACSD